MKKPKAAVELDAELHAQLQKFCKLTGSRVRDVLERLIEVELKRKMPSC